MKIVRWLTSLVLGAGITVGLFYFMQALIATGAQLNQQTNVTQMADATMPEIEMEVQENVEPPEQMEEMEEPPPQQEERDFEMEGTGNMNIARDDVSVDPGVNIGAAGLSVTDGDMMPLVNIQPEYPTRAAQRGIEGWCQVEFTVTPEGGVENVHVVDAEPQGMFNRASIRAAERFRFQPRVVDGEAVEVPGVQYVFRFELEDN